MMPRVLGDAELALDDEAGLRKGTLDAFRRIPLGPDLPIMLAVKFVPPRPVGNGAPPSLKRLAAYLPLSRDELGPEHIAPARLAAQSASQRPDAPSAELIPQPGDVQPEVEWVRGPDPRRDIRH